MPQKNIKQSKQLSSRRVALKPIAAFIAITVLFQAIFPPVSMALTGGASQPEVQGFQPIGASDMVDLFTGDFSYNIPLLDVDGYPINIAYSAGASMDTESSWVGLGWSLNPGVINRNLRGLPDDFKGDNIQKEQHLRENTTIGVNGGVSSEFFGFFGLSASLGVFHNNYTGFGVEAGISPSLSTKNGDDTAKLGGTVGIGLNYNSQSGLNVQPNIGLFHEKRKHFRRDFSIGANYNSIRGLKAVTVSASAKNMTKNQSNGFMGSGRLGANYSFGDFTYFPTSSLPLENSGFTFRGTVGAEAFGAHPGFQINGYATTQQLISPYGNQAAFGYLYSQEGQEIETSLQDFNRDKDMAFRERNPILPMTYGTYDIFAASGQGLSGQFRTMRNDIGIYREAATRSVGATTDLGLEIGLGNAFHAGGDFIESSSSTRKGKWISNNNMTTRMPFTDSKEVYEATYMKSSGEKIITDLNFFDKVGGSDPIHIQLEKAGASSRAKATLVKSKNLQVNNTEAIGSTLQRSTTNREKRNQLMSYLTASEAALVGLDKEIKSYPEDTLVVTSCDAQYIDVIQRTEGIRQDHHISEITITQPDGSRYIYGIPVYNTLQEEVSFNLGSSVTLSGETLAEYTEGTDNSINNMNGDDQFYDKQTIPAYAHAYLLTAVLSPDYVDRTGDGVSDDDFGNATQLNYTRVYSDTDADAYRWRSPYEHARYQEGLKAKTGDHTDDKGSYVYGKKEVWYLHSIESRTMMAQFHLSNRTDSYGVEDDNGGFDNSQPLRKLDKIELFSKSELIEDLSTMTLSSDPLPIKTVHFEYSYQLCGDAVNNKVYDDGLTSGLNIVEDGKLTLTKLWFTYQRSNRGALNAYHFKYGTDGNGNTIYNPNYNIDHYDRWGNYKKTPNTATSAADNANYPLYDDFPNNSDFPYVLQDKALADEYTNAWNLTEIELPSGSTIHVEYEADDYAYIQDKRAGQMLFLRGFASTVGGGVNSNLFDNVDNPKEYIVFDLVEPVTDLDEFKRRYLEDVKQIYYQCLVDLDGNGQDDYIKGYLDYDKTDMLLRNDNGTNGSIAIKITDFPVVKGNTYHPISYATLQHLRLYYPEIIFSNYDMNPANPENTIRTLYNLGDEFKNLFKGFLRNSVNKGWAKEVTENKSWIRLANPNFKKLGGGCRVKSVAVSDNWEDTWGDIQDTNTADDKNSFYGQTYHYETETTLGDQIINISSGVASYEPMIGNEENPFREAIVYTEQASATVNNEFFVEKPIGEALFPSPIVGYSKVKVVPFGRYGTDNFQEVGYSENEFYTAKDFPVRTDYSRVSPPVKVETNPILKFFKINVKEHMAASQGFVVEINDMHGKPKSESSFDKNGSLLSATSYRYKVENGDSAVQQLNNTVPVVQEDGSISSVNIGLEVDVWQDMREESNYTEAVGVKTNADGFLALIVPIIGAAPFPTVHKESKSVRTAVTTKLIKRIGLLDEVIAMENGSKVTTKNMLYDGETGNVLLTKTQNEFDDAMYQFTYPAHWMYEGMAQGYQNIGAIFDAIDIDNGKIQGTFNYDFISAGDELVVEQINNGTYTLLPDKYTVVPTGNGISDYSIVDKNGEVLEPTGGADYTYRFKIIRSGRRNQAGVPIGSVASRQVPLNTNGDNLEVNASKEILQISATEFSDTWGMECNITANVADANCPNNTNVLFGRTINPYEEGAWGNWRPFQSWVYHTARTPSAVNTSNPTTVNRSIQKTGIYSVVAPFWTYNSMTNKWEATINTNWVRANTVGEYDLRGNELENEDAIGNYSAALFGYNKNRATAIASNAQFREVFYDGFEDYNFDNDCMVSNPAPTTATPFSVYNPSQNNLSDTKSHTGKYALIIPSNTTMSSSEAIVDCCNANSGGGVGTTTVPPPPSNPSPTTVPIKNAQTEGTYIINDCTTCLPRFQPKEEEYFITAWVATQTSIDCGSSPANTSVNIYFNNNTTIDAVTLYPQEAIIDGWQRVAGLFEVPSGAVSFHLDISNTANEDLYLDDIRIHPKNSNMVSYVYDPQSLRLMAQLDDNNYASFYEYDDEGILIRTKRETERGIVTIQEARTVLKPNN